MDGGDFYRQPIGADDEALRHRGRQSGLVGGEPSGEPLLMAKPVRALDCRFGSAVGGHLIVIADLRSVTAGLDSPGGCEVGGHLIA